MRHTSPESNIPMNVMSTPRSIAIGIVMVAILSTRTTIDSIMVPMMPAKTVGSVSHRQVPAPTSLDIATAIRTTARNTRAVTNAPQYMATGMTGVVVAKRMAPTTPVMMLTIIPIAVQFHLHWQEHEQFDIKSPPIAFYAEGRRRVKINYDLAVNTARIFANCKFDIHR